MLPMSDTNTAPATMIFDRDEIMGGLHSLAAVLTIVLLVFGLGDDAGVEQARRDPGDVQVDEQHQIDQVEQVRVLVPAQDDDHVQRYYVRQDQQHDAKDFFIMLLLLFGPSTRNGSPLRIQHSFVYWPSLADEFYIQFIINNLLLTNFLNIYLSVLLHSLHWLLLFGLGPSMEHLRSL